MNVGALWKQTARLLLLSVLSIAEPDDIGLVQRRPVLINKP